MYSTLHQQPQLSLVRMGSAMKHAILLSWLFLSASKFYFISRNPYDRMASFFKDKFRNAVDYYDRKGYWQTSQILFFPYLGIDESTAPEVVKQRLLATSFDEVMAVLPEVYMKDKHLRPQWLITRIKVKTWSVPIKIIKVFKVESSQDLKQLQELFQVDVSAKANSTGAVKESLIWTRKEIEIIDKLYHKDFKYFNYKKRAV